MNKFKKSVSFLLTLVMLLSVCVPTAFAEGSNTLYIVHTNDIHGRIDENLKAKTPEMGMGRVKTFVDSLKSEKKDVLLVDAGDTIHGQPITNLKDQQGKIVIETMNAVGYDVMVPGNHDFNFGSKRLVELSKIAKFPIICANIVDKDGKTILDPYTIIEKGGLKIGIFGISTPETQVKSHPANTAGLKFLDEVEVSKEMVKTLREEKKVDIVIALVHLGVSEESEVTSKKLAENVKGIDLIIDGHSHTELENGLKVNGTMIVQTGSYLHNLGLVELSIKDHKVESVTAKLIKGEELSKLAVDKDIEKIIEPVRKTTDNYMNTVIGKTEIALNGERKDVRTGETNLGDLIADALMHSFKGAVAAITNGGGVRASIPAGEITARQVFTSFPFDNTPVLVTVNGEAIKAALEHSTKAWPAEAGSFPQVAGMSFTIDENRPAGDRITDIKIAGEPLDLKKEYKIVTNDFMAAGGDGYTMFKNAPQEKLNEEMNAVLVQYIKSMGGNVKTISEGRIKTVKKDAATVIDYDKHWAKADIEKVLEMGVFTNMPDGKFDPDRAATRAMIVEAFAKLEKVKLSDNKESQFKDVKAGTETAAAVNWAFENKIVAGVSKDEFMPETNITREQFAAIFVRYIKYKNLELKKDQKVELKDADKISAWAKDDVQALISYGIIKGDDMGMFNPKNNVTRAESASMLIRLLNLKDGK